MAEEKLEKVDEKEVKAEEKAPKKKKGPGIFKRMGGFFVDCKSEMKKVVWLSRAETVKKTLVVSVMMLVTGVAIGVVDLLLTQLILLLGNLL